MIIDYVKGFLVLFLLIKVLLYFVPKSNFSRYIAFFSGVVLVIGLLQPFLSLSGKEKNFLEYQKWEKELLKLEEEAEKIQEEGKALIEELSVTVDINNSEMTAEIETGMEYE